MPTTQEEFMQRIVGIFDADAARTWSRLQRAVFNKLVGDLVFRHGYAGISDDMLMAAKANMERMIGACMRAQPIADLDPEP